MNNGTISDFCGLRVIASPLIKPIPVLQVSPKFEWYDGVLFSLVPLPSAI